MHSILRKRVVMAAGSAMDVFPITDYSEYVPHGSSNQRIFGYWQRAGRYIEKAVTIYVADEGQIGTLDNGEKSSHSKKVFCKYSKADAEGRPSA